MTTIATTGADALLAATEATNTQMAAKLAARQTRLEAAVEFGKQSAAGSLSILDMGFAFVNGVIAGELNESDSKAIYTAYVQGFNEVQHIGAERKPVPGIDKAAAASLSMFTTAFGKPFVALAVGRGGSWFEGIARVRREANQETKSVYNCFVNCARDGSKAWIEAGKPEGEAFDKWFDATCVDAWVRPRCVKAEVTPKADIEAIIEALTKALKKSDGKSDLSVLTTLIEGAKHAAEAARDGRPIVVTTVEKPEPVAETVEVTGETADRIVAAHAKAAKQKRVLVAAE